MPIIRTSVDHGTAFDIAGRNQADATNMKAAMRLAVRMAEGKLALASESAGSSAGHTLPIRPTLEARAEMHLADTLIIAAYLATLVGIGIFVAGRQKTTDSYFVAGRTVPGWAAGLSLLATIITSLTFIAFPGAAYSGDW